jgi:uncharacterized RDD family membrane protein YckC
MSGTNAFCSRCGAEAAVAGDPFCARCGARLVAGDETRALIYQGVEIRFVAQLVDALPVVVFFWLCGRLIAGLSGGTTATGFVLEGPPALLGIGLATAFWIAYPAVLEAIWNGQTLGKRLVGIKVVRGDGAPPGWSPSVVRPVLRPVDAMAGSLVAAVLVWQSPREPRLGDRVAGTFVVKSGG